MVKLRKHKSVWYFTTQHFMLINIEKKYLFWYKKQLHQKRLRAEENENNLEICYWSRFYWQPKPKIFEDANSLKYIIRFKCVIKSKWQQWVNNLIFYDKIVYWISFGVLLKIMEILRSLFYAYLRLILLTLLLSSQ